ncbi:hypothetical protein GUR47_10155 [Streptomyces tendae]|uniref:Uncharacterized protein n=1 Tax=Streptomyces tendae TaxID=1932 RepID=A0A6B3QL52_STRTE|nr:hypothetical protein [Streptomyces tendae]NEV87021.1 hypothetical protein [Streptomyces tendae]
MSFRLQGDGVRLDFDGRRWLVFSWSRRDGVAGGVGGRLYVEPACCLSVAGRLSDQDGSLRLTFRFRPSGVSAGDVVAELVVGADQAEPAWQFTQWFAHTYRVEDVSASWWDDDAEPSAGERERSRDWLGAPVSPATRDLFRSVMARLTVADS